jgi:hypothetical protein
VLDEVPVRPGAHRVDGDVGTEVIGDPFHVHDDVVVLVKLYLSAWAKSSPSRTGIRGGR